MLIETKAKVYRNKTGSHAIIKAPYHPQMIEKIKVIPGAKWHNQGDLKFWAVPADQLEAARQAVRPFYQIEGEESQVEWKTVKMRVRFAQHQTRSGSYKCGKAIIIDTTDLLNVQHGNFYECSSDYDVLEAEGGFIQGDEHAAYWTVEYIMTVKMRKNAVIEAYAGTYEIIEEEA